MLKAKPNAHPKAASSAQMKQHPVAPAVYRPLPVPRVLQTKATSPQPNRGVVPVPKAPPVYRPQLPKVLQAKSPVAQLQGGQKRPQSGPVAPPVYKPQPTPKVLQRKVSPNEGMPHPPKPVNQHTTRHTVSVPLPLRVIQRAELRPSPPSTVNNEGGVPPNLKKEATVYIKSKNLPAQVAENRGGGKYLLVGHGTREFDASELRSSFVTGVPHVHEEDDPQFAEWDRLTRANWELREGYDLKCPVWRGERKSTRESYKSATPNTGQKEETKPLSKEQVAELAWNRLVHVVTLHAFSEGNGRTALLELFTVIGKHGYLLNMSAEDIYIMTMADDKFEGKELIGKRLLLPRIIENMVPREDNTNFVLTANYRELVSAVQALKQKRLKARAKPNDPESKEYNRKVSEATKLYQTSGGTN